MAADERMTNFVERLAEKWTRIAEQNGCDHEPTICRGWALNSIRHAVCESLTEAALVVRAHDIAIGTEAAERVARQIERLRDE